MHYSGCQGHVKVRSRSLTFDELGSLFRVLHVSWVVFGADFEFSIHLNIYEVTFMKYYEHLVPS